MSDYIIWGLCLVLILGQALPLDWFRRLEQSDYRAHRASKARARTRIKQPKFERPKH